MTKEDTKHVNLYGEYVAYCVTNGDSFEKFTDWLAGDGLDKKNKHIPAVDKIRNLLQEAYCVITVDKPIDYGHQLRTANGTVVNIYQTGKVVVQGTRSELIKSLIK